jgi:hypothetical protein
MIHAWHNTVGDNNMHPSFPVFRASDTYAIEPVNE